MPVTVIVIVLVADIQPEWEPDYGVRMKLAFYAAIAVPFPLSAASVHRRMKDCHIEDLLNSSSATVVYREDSLNFTVVLQLLGKYFLLIIWLQYLALNSRNFYCVDPKEN